MTRDEFVSTSIALLRSAVGWQSAIARRLGCDSRIIRRILTTGNIPPWIEAKLGELMGARDVGPWPRDEWIVGDGVSADGKRREYVVHVMAPRFVARVVECDGDGHPMPGEEPADVVSGTVYVADGAGTSQLLLCEIEWIDEVAPGQMTALLEAACDALDRAPTD